MRHHHIICHHHLITYHLCHQLSSRVSCHHHHFATQHHHLFVMFAHDIILRTYHDILHGGGAKTSLRQHHRNIYKTSLYLRVRIDIIGDARRRLTYHHHFNTLQTRQRNIIYAVARRKHLYHRAQNIIICHLLRMLLYGARGNT